MSSGRGISAAMILSGGDGGGEGGRDGGREGETDGEVWRLRYERGCSGGFTHTLHTLLSLTVEKRDVCN